jgi:hypothetical protein
MQRGELVYNIYDESEKMNNGGDNLAYPIPALKVW